MRYFIANLAMHLVITGVFVLLTCVAAGRNKTKKTKHVIFYFFPIIFALASVLYIVFYTAPRLMDINSLINSNYYYNSGTVEKIGFAKNYFSINGEHYYLNPLHNKLVEGDTICIEPMSCLGKPANYVDKDDGWSVKMKDGSTGCHCEHTILVTKDGYEVLTLPD